MTTAVYSQAKRNDAGDATDDGKWVAHVEWLTSKEMYGERQVIIQDSHEVTWLQEPLNKSLNTSGLLLNC